MIYVISFDAARATMARAIENWLRSNYDNYANPVPGTWIVDGPLVADQIHSGLRPLLEESDRLLIIKSGMEAMWHGIANEDAEWIAANFPASLSERIPGKTEGVTPVNRR